MKELKPSLAKSRFWKAAYLMARESPWVESIEIVDDPSSIVVTMKGRAGGTVSVVADGSKMVLLIGTAYTIERELSSTSASKISEAFLAALRGDRAYETLGRASRAAHTAAVQRLHMAGLLIASQGGTVRSVDGVWHVANLQFDAVGRVRLPGGRLADVCGDRFLALGDRARVQTLVEPDGGFDQELLPTAEYVVSTSARQGVFTPNEDEFVFVSREGIYHRWAFRADHEAAVIEELRGIQGHSLTFWWSDRVSWLLTSTGNALRWPQLRVAETVEALRGELPPSHSHCVCRFVGARGALALVRGETHEQEIAVVHEDPAVHGSDLRAQIARARFADIDGSWVTQVAMQGAGGAVAYSTPDAHAQAWREDAPAWEHTAWISSGGHPDGIALHPRRPLLALFSRAVNLWDLERDASVGDFSGDGPKSDGSRCGGVFLDDGEHLVVGRGRDWFLIDLVSRNIHHLPFTQGDDGGGFESAVAISPSGRYVALGGGTLRVLKASYLVTLGRRSSVVARLTDRGGGPTS